MGGPDREGNAANKVYIIKPLPLWVIGLHLTVETLEQHWYMLQGHLTEGGTPISFSHWLRVSGARGSLISQHFQPVAWVGKVDFKIQRRLSGLQLEIKLIVLKQEGEEDIGRAQIMSVTMSNYNCSRKLQDLYIKVWNVKYGIIFPKAQHSNRLD